jgi:hypothetical protein
MMRAFVGVVGFAIVALLVAVGGCGPATGSDGGPCNNTSFDTTSCDKGLICVDDCGGGDGTPPTLFCSPTCQACSSALDANGDCPAGGEGEGEGEGEGAGQ